MIIEQKDFEYILCNYGIQIPLTRIKKLQEFSDGREKLRLIYFLETIDGQQWICRLTNERQYPIDLVERQSAFAMLLKKNGISTPKKLCKDGHYCFYWPKNEIKLCVTLETYMGSNLESADLKIFGTFGGLLGQMHIISQLNPVHLGFSTIAHAIYTGKACYANILRQAKPEIPYILSLQKAANLHDTLVSILRPVWSKLPMGAVHGDLGLYNNLVVSHLGLTVIDFNLAGDEVYLGDLLAAYYSSIHKYDWQNRLKSIDKSLARRKFLKEYVSYRTLTTLEQQYFPIVSALFDGLYYSKAVIERWNKSPLPTVMTSFEKIPALFAAGFAK